MIILEIIWNFWNIGIMANFIHPLADCKSDNIGENTNIWQFCVIFKNAQIGNNCNICAHVLVEDDVIIGNNVTVKSGVQLWNGVRIGDNVFIGPNVTFTNEHFSRSKQYPDRFEQTLVKEFASLGGIIIATSTGSSVYSSNSSSFGFFRNSFNSFSSEIVFGDKMHFCTFKESALGKNP